MFLSQNQKMQMYCYWKIFLRFQFNSKETIESILSSLYSIFSGLFVSLRLKTTTNIWEGGLTLPKGIAIFLTGSLTQPTGEKNNIEAKPLLLITTRLAGSFNKLNKIMIFCH